jgi:hypothetical protein
LVSSFILVAAELVALRAINMRGEPILSVEAGFVSEMVPAAEVV